MLFILSSTDFNTTAEVVVLEVLMVAAESGGEIDVGREGEDVK